MIGGIIPTYTNKCEYNKEINRSDFINKCIPLISLSNNDINIYDTKNGCLTSDNNKTMSSYV